MKPVLIYCYDAYCGWCYGFSDIISRLSAEFSDRLSFEVLSGGMIMPVEPVHIGVTAGYIREAYRTVEERSGKLFGDEYLWHIFNPDKSDWYPHSLKPAIALCVFKDYLPHLQVPFVTDLQEALHFEGRDLTDNEAYRHLLEKYGLPADEFYGKLESAEYRTMALEEFELVKQLKVTGFPTVLIQIAESRFFLVSRGFVDYPDIRAQIERIVS